jgi:hypothetical protein
MKLLFITLCIALSLPLSAQEYSTALMAAKMDLDSAWFSIERPVDKICLPAESNLLRKKDMSDHACLEEVIKMAKLEGADAAIPWLKATFCHNQPAQDRVGRAGTEAVRYVMDKWGGGSATIAGAVKAAAVEPVVLKINFTNKTGEILFLYSLFSDQPDGKRDCHEYQYVGQLQPNRSHLQVISKGRYMWLRVSGKKANDGCGEFRKEYKVGPAADQEMSSSDEIIIK